MRTTLLSILFTLSFFSYCGAQSFLPVDSATGKVTYRFKLSTAGKLSKESLYQTLQNWFEAHPELFTRGSVEATSGESKPKMKAEVEKVFANKMPLQSLDPESERLAGKVIVKYTGYEGACIHTMYLQYYLVMMVSEKGVTAEISDIRYNHFNNRTYQPQRFLHFSDFSSCEAISFIEYLNECQQCPEEYNRFCQFFNQDVENLFSNLKEYVRSTEGLTLATPVSKE